jgi:hypothetical protein
VRRAGNVRRDACAAAAAQKTGRSAHAAFRPHRILRRSARANAAQNAIRRHDNDLPSDASCATIAEIERAVIAAPRRNGQGFMRRNSPAILLLLLAMVIQAMAPAVARVIVARGQNDGAAIYTLCVSLADQQSKAPGRLHHNAPCLLCEIACDGAAPLAARISLAGAAPVQWTSSDWTAADHAPPASLLSAAHRARAPPLLPIDA